MLPAKSENHALRDGQTYRHSNTIFSNGAYNIIPPLFKVAGYKKPIHMNLLSRNPGSAPEADLKRIKTYRYLLLCHKPRSYIVKLCSCVGIYESTLYTTWFVQGKKYLNIALVLQDEWLTTFTHPANTCTCPLKSICNKEHKWVICYATSSSNSFESTHPVHSSFRASA